MAGRPKQFDDSSNAARQKRTREALEAKGGRILTLRLTAQHLRVIEAHKARKGIDSDAEAIRDLLLNP